MWLSFIKPLPAYFCNFLSCTKIATIQEAEEATLTAIAARLDAEAAAKN